MINKEKKLFLKAEKIYNSHDLCNRFNANNKKVFIHYRTQDLGRASQCAAWQIIGIGFSTDKNGYWRDYGHKTFSLYDVHKEKSAKLLEAIEFAKQKCYGEEWVKDPFEAYQTKETIGAMNLWLKNHEKEIQIQNN